MKIFDWKTLLTEWNHVLLNSKMSKYVPNDIYWLGHPPATEGEIAALEQRINHSLPPSYRQFLAFTNGWTFLSTSIGQLWSIRDVAWFSERNPEVIEIFEDLELEEVEVMRVALEVNESINNEWILLNPDVVDEAGEWQAVRLYETDPPQTYASFWDFVNAEIQDAKRLMLFAPTQFGRTDTRPAHEVNREKVRLARTFIEERIRLMEKTAADLQLPQDERVELQESIVKLRDLLAQLVELESFEADADLLKQRKAELLEKLEQPNFVASFYPMGNILGYCIILLE